MSPWPLLAMLLLVLLPVRGYPQEPSVVLPPSVQALLAETAGLADAGERAVQISTRFLGTPYVANTLGGGASLPEHLVVRLDAVDCFTFLDYVEALRRSAAPAEFHNRLAEVRYRDGRIAWETRRHFFTDWAVAAEGRVADVTAEVGGNRTLTADKRLNRKGDAAFYLAGVPVQERSVGFIPGRALDRSVLERLRSGDYLGIYSPDPGLDVTHVGMVVRANDHLLFRHASSRQDDRRVIDSDLAVYLAGKPGIVVLRPLPLPSP